MIRLLSVLLSLTLLFSCGNEESNPPTYKNQTAVKESVRDINFTLVNSYEHDINSFTEGLVFHNGQLFESTGATGDLPQTKSLFGIVDLKTGKIDVKVEIDKDKYFGEGIIFLNGKVYQLTYKNQIGFVYDATTFKKIKSFSYSNKEGWGLTTDGKYIIMSDGTNNLTYLDPNTLQPVKTKAVSENGYAKDFLNELEFINGYIYANIWGNNTIVKIDTSNGKIVAKLNLNSLADSARKLHPRSFEMNGIAFDSITDKIYVTGKMWPKIYEIQFEH